MVKVKNRFTGEIFEAKIITIAGHEEKEQKDAWVAEMTMMQKLDSPFIAKIKDSYMEPKRLIMIIEFCEGGSL